MYDISDRYVHQHSLLLSLQISQIRRNVQTPFSSVGAHRLLLSITELLLTLRPNLDDAAVDNEERGRLRDAQFLFGLTSCYGISRQCADAVYRHRRREIAKKMIFDVACQMNVDNIDAMIELLSWSLATHTHDTFTYYYFQKFQVSIHIERETECNEYRYIIISENVANIAVLTIVCLFVGELHHSTSGRLRGWNPLDRSTILLGKMDYISNSHRLGTNYLAGLILSTLYTLLFS